MQTGGVAMAYQRFGGIVHGRISDENTRDRMQNAIDSAETEMGDYSDAHVYGGYRPNQHSETVTPAGEGTDNTEISYLRNFAEELGEKSRSGDLNVYNGDCWIVLDDMYNWGYGRTIRGQTIENENGEIVVHVGRSLDLQNSPSPEPNDDSIGIIKHNIGHAMSLNGASGHSKGGYKYNYSGYIKYVSPMARAYLYASEDSGNYLSDTCGAGEGGVPEDFNCGS